MKEIIGNIYWLEKAPAPGGSYTPLNKRTYDSAAEAKLAAIHFLDLYPIIRIVKEEAILVREESERIPV